MTISSAHDATARARPAPAPAGTGRPTEGVGDDAQTRPGAPGSGRPDGRCCDRPGGHDGSRPDDRHDSRPGGGDGGTSCTSSWAGCRPSTALPSTGISCRHRTPGSTASAEGGPSPVPPCAWARSPAVEPDRGLRGAGRAGGRPGLGRSLVPRSVRTGRTRASHRRHRRLRPDHRPLHRRLPQPRLVGPSPRVRRLLTNLHVDASGDRTPGVPVC